MSFQIPGIYRIPDCNLPPIQQNTKEAAKYQGSRKIPRKSPLAAARVARASGHVAAHQQTFVPSGCARNVS
eukprot:1985529-Prymnesium_polylepis.1